MDSHAIDNILPAGFEDLLPPLAAIETTAVSSLCNTFADFGFQQVKPPLLEYVNTLHSETGETIADSLFETQDPLSSQSLALRADITVQIARIAATRLAATPRPLRVCYAGQVARRKADEARSARQFTQAGIEIVGLDEADRLAADVEAIRVITTALKKLGVKELIVDLTMPSLVRDFAQSIGIDGAELDGLFKALDRRDEVRVKAFGNATLTSLLSVSGDAKQAISALLAKPELKTVESQISDMAALIDHLSGVEGLNLTLDVCEQRSTSYHQAIGFNLFVPGHSRQVGAGGRYMTKGAMASGATLYLDGLLPILGGLDEKSRKLLVPLSTSDKQLEAYQAEGWTTVFSTNPTAATAQQTDCSHYLCETTQTIKEV